MKFMIERYARLGIITAKLLLLAIGSSGQGGPKALIYPSHLPYSFGNVVWWNNDELRALLKEHIPGLGDEIAPTSAEEGRVRAALKILLKEKGIVAEIQSVEPSEFSLTAERAPGAPGPAIVFTVLSPKILISKVIISDSPTDLASGLNQKLQLREGHDYSGGQDWLIHSNIQEELTSKGYLDPVVDLAHDAPRKERDHYVVNLLISVKAGPQYHISSITADGGPLLTGRDLSSFFTEKAGDVAGAGPFGRLAGELRAFYWHQGYAGVAINGPATLEQSHALVSYHLNVVPGPVYHLRSLSITKLNQEQEGSVRQQLGMKPGDIFDQTAVNALYHKLAASPSLAAYGFTFSPQIDKGSASADLTLDFYKVSDASSVTVH